MVKDHFFTFNTTPFKKKFFFTITSKKKKKKRRRRRRGICPFLKIEEEEEN
jgi:hypothetical protein